jgi:hypothetical protein
MARSPAPAREAATHPAARIGLPTVLLAALALRLLLAAGNSGLTMDSPLYVRMAEDVRAGRVEPAPAHEGYPLLVAAASFAAPGRELPGRLVSLVASLALVVLVWEAALRRMSPAFALLPAGLVALHPLLAVYGGAIMTESTFLALAFAGALCFDAGRAAAGGVLLGAAWWVRPEAAVLAPVAALCAPLRARQRWLALLLAACVALPHSLALRWTHGSWSLSPKSVLVRAPAADARAEEWRLADPTAFADSVGLGTRLARDGAAIARAYPARLVAQGRRVLQAWPVPLLLASLAGLALLRMGAGWLGFFALPLVTPLLAAPADLRFTQLLLPSLALLAGLALARAWAKDPRAGIAVGVLVALGTAWAWGGPAGDRALAFDDGPMAALRGAGEWLATHSPADAVVMDRKSYVPFFANRRHVQLPDEPLDVVLEHARTSGATHLVVEEYVVRSLRPQLAPLLDADRIAREPRVRIVHATRPAPGDGVAVFEVVR